MAITPEPRPWRALACVALVLIPALLALGAPQPQQKKKVIKPYALIYGSVFGPDGRSRYGVPIKIRRADEKKARWETMSDHAGEFAVRVPPGPGNYIVWADIKVPKGESKPEAKVRIEAEERVDIGLHLKR